MKLKHGIEITTIPNMSHLSAEQKKWWGKWIIALKSGEYKQTYGQLRQSEGLCCLGVVQDIVKDEVGGSWASSCPGDPDAPGSYFCGQDDDYSMYFLILSVRKLLGVKKSTGFEVITYKDELLDLSGLNDGGATFEEIAQILQVALDGGATY